MSVFEEAQSELRTFIDLFTTNQLVIEKHSKSMIYFEQHGVDEDGLSDITSWPIYKGLLISLMFDIGKTAQEITDFFKQSILTTQAREEDDEHDYQPLGDEQTAAFIENMMLESLIDDEDETGDTGLSF